MAMLSPSCTLKRKPINHVIALLGAKQQPSADSNGFNPPFLFKLSAVGDSNATFTAFNKHKNDGGGRGGGATNDFRGGLMVSGTHLKDARM